MPATPSRPEREPLEGPPDASPPGGTGVPPHGPPPHGSDPATEAIAYCDKAIALLNQLRTEHPNVPEYRHLLALCYRERPPTPGFNGTNQAVELLESLSRESPNVADYRYELSETYANVDVRDPHYAAANRDTILAQLKKGLTLSEALVKEHPEVPEYKSSQAELLLRVGTVHAHSAERVDLATRRSRLKEAESAFRQAVALQTGLVERYPAVLNQQVWLARMQQQLARTLSSQSNHKEARSLLEASIRQLETTLARNPKFGVLNISLYENNQLLSEVLENLHETRAAKDARERASKHRELFRPPERSG